MSNAISFLDAIGNRPLSFTQYADALALLDVDDEQRHALLNRDPAKLKELLGGRSRVMMMVWAPQEDSADEFGDEVSNAPDGHSVRCV